MATMWRGMASFNNRATHSVVRRLTSQTREDYSVMRLIRASPRTTFHSSNIRVSKLCHAPLGNYMKKKCFWPSFFASVNGSEGMEPEEPEEPSDGIPWLDPSDEIPWLVAPNNDSPDIESPEKQILAGMLKKNTNGAANVEASSEDDFPSTAESDSSKTSEDRNWKQFTEFDFLWSALKIVVTGIFRSVKIEQLILTVFVTLAWIKAFYDIGLANADLFHALCPVDKPQYVPSCVVFLELFRKYFP